MATEGWPGAGSGLVGDAHREVLGRLVERFERIRAGDTTVARTIVLSGASGVGKSRIVREFYRHLQEAQPAPGYWPLLPEDDARQGHGSEVDPFPLRKVLGPETNGFVWSAGAFPSFTWWTFECGRTQGGGLRDTVAESRPVLELHLLPAMRSKAAGLGVGKKALGHMDALIARLREAGTEDAVEGVNQAITALGGAAVPGLGLLLDWTSRGIRAAGKASEVRALEWSDVSFGGMAEQSRRSVAEEFADLVLATAHPAVPALVIVEDAHQIDASVRTFLERMSTRAADRPTMVITTACPGGERNNSTYREWRTWETQYKNMEVCEVPDLAAESLVTLLRRSAPKTLDGDAHAVVARYPNPLALKLVLGLDSVKRAIRRNNGALPLDAVDLSGLPKTFKELYDKRIAELPPRVREAVIAAKGTLPTSAPTGPYAPGVVGAAAEHALEVPGKETAAGLADAVDDGLSSAVGGWHQFREALLAEVLAERVDPTDRAELQEATRRELRRHIAAARGDRYFLNRSSAFDVQVALWLTQLVDETPETVDDAVALITVAATLHDTYQYKSAATLLQKAIPQLPTDHPDTLAWRNNLAYAYRAAGDLSRAIPLFEATLTDSIRVLGPDHPSTLASRNNLAATYRAAGDLGRAIPLFEATLADSIRVLGPDHANTLASRNNLASAYQAAGDIGRAIPLLEAVLADRVRVIGADHHDTLTSRNNLAGAYRAAGDLGRAIPLFEATLTDRTRVLGPDHPDTLASRNNLAGAYRAAGDLSRAIPLFEATLTDSIRVLGPDHPNTL
ncbi:MAG TPA: tetratricopeptide repeat protein, partial [Actinomycetaceae bacterium]|nr:tetratricopeptide repeat protein [Actinomycetaceae bacterium]